MQFSDLVTKVMAYVRIEGADIETMAKTQVNNAILAFLRSQDWEKLQKLWEFSTDKSHTVTGITRPGAPDELIHISADFRYQFSDGDSITLTGSDAAGTYTVNGTPTYSGGETLIKVSEDIPGADTDGTIDSAVNTIRVPTDFFFHLSLIAETTEYQYHDYKDYLLLSSKTSAFTIVGNKIHVEGGGADLSLIYLFPGDPYPLSANTDESEPLIYYHDIIYQWTLWLLLEFLNAKDEDLANIKNRLSMMLTDLRRSENRAKNRGKVERVGFHNR